MAAQYSECPPRTDDQPYEIGSIEATAALWYPVAGEAEESHAYDAIKIRAHHGALTGAAAPLLSATSDAPTGDGEEETRSSLHNRHVSTPTSTTLKPQSDFKRARVIPKGWPTSPSRIRSPWWAIVGNAL